MEAVLMDLEGLDCAVMRTRDWCATPWPKVVTFERTHCHWLSSDDAAMRACGFLAAAASRISARRYERVPIASLADSIATIAAHASSTLPRVSASDLRQCGQHRAGTPLSSCVHLSNPATGSTSLAAAFKREPFLQNLTFVAHGIEVSRQRTFPTVRYPAIDYMHTHMMGVGDVQHFLRGKQLPPAECFVMTLRDPATRLESAFRDSCEHGEILCGSLSSSPQRKHNLSQLVAKLQHAFEYEETILRPPVVQLPRPASRVASLYSHSASGHPRWLYNRIVDGSAFLTSQIGFLRGMACPQVEVHFICTERFEADWRALRSLFGQSSGREWRLHSKHVPDSSRVSVLSSSEKAWIREVLYPWDTALWHGAGCGSSTGSSTTTSLATG